MKAFKEIEKSLLTIYPFTAQQLAMFTNKLSLKEIQKKEFLLKQNQVCSHIAFVVKGSFRLYTETEQKEWTINFFTENNWVADLESLMLKQPSKNYIEANENSKVARISLIDIHSLMEIHPCFHMLNSLIANLSVSTNQISTLKIKSPDERYQQLLANKPHWMNRFPQMQIASYLGITPETLSRVRARKI
ncbi:Crp/Fnr family transcriptional regulator [Zunongwangia pacifica]|uniref:Crp/Fnr family transcriptional regulator n=1 Tax=Zunongwangia pacifica TaxID=2911062 RepID=A0A9X1ZXP0_9FLAO|nr:Crp/Fnr family transcriptional regulator [Zunongwangia pacifica]MCL6220468.1 Crp/Fnr family transcriptional regulator [Zunongwangia pacifica]